MLQFPYYAQQTGNSQHDYVLWASGNVLIEFGASGNTDLRIRWNLDGTWRNTHIVNNVLDIGTWHHWAFTFDQGITTVYKDGLEIYSGSDSQTSISTNSPDYCIGYRDGAGGFDGTLDDIRIYDRALSETKIQTLAF